MLGSQVFQQFLKEAPICVMARATLENVFAPQKVDALFHSVAQTQYERELMFSTLVDVMSLVVCRVHPSVHAVYQRQQDSIPVSIKALYDKLNHVESQTSRALVRHTAGQAETVIRKLKGGCRPLLPGYRVKILDGNHLQGTEHRLKELRTKGGGALPGICLAVLDPEFQTICDVIPCEDAHTQECKLLDGILETVQPRDVFVDDRHFCTSDFFWGLMQRKAFFVTRQHAGHLRWQLIGKPKRCGRCETGIVFEQRVRLTHPKTGDTRLVRRITVKLDKPTRDGDAEIHILTNLAARAARALQVAELYRHRWNLETAFQEMTVHLRCELNTLGYPPAALFGFCTAAACYNIFSVLRGALRSVQGEPTVAENVSNFFLAEELRGTYRGLMIALPPAKWRRFQSLPPRDLAKLLKTWARGIDLSRYRKHPRSPKIRHIRPRAPTHHFATARLLKKKNQKRKTKPN